MGVIKHKIYNYLDSKILAIKVITIAEIIEIIVNNTVIIIKLIVLFE